MEPFLDSVPIVEPEMMFIPAGPFLMGTSEKQVDRLSQRDGLAKKWKEKGYFGREQPQHRLNLASYALSKYPVTVAEYRGFIMAGGYCNSNYWTEAGWNWRESLAKARPEHWDDERFSGDGRFPVIGVSWYEALAYCLWLTEKIGKHYRLPTEVEWEKAARGPNDWLYPWGDQFDINLCNTRASSLHHPEPVGKYSPGGDSIYGCAEMIGNVSEWTSSQFKPYPYDANDGRENEHEETERVLRAGSWYQPVLRARIASRGMNDPFFVDTDVGFRCALTL